MSTRGLGFDMFSGEYSPLTQSALKYTWHELVRRIGSAISPDERTLQQLDVPIYYAQSERVNTQQPSIIVTPCAEESWSRLLGLGPDSLDWIAEAAVVPPDNQIRLTDSIPVLFWGAEHENGDQPFVERREDGSVIFYADILAAAFFMLSRWEETVVTERDEHGRFPATAAVAYKQGFLDRPIVDEYALILQAWLQLLVPEWRPPPKQLSVKLSHDIDMIRLFHPAALGLRVLGGDLFKRGDLGSARDSARNLAAQTLAPQYGSYYQDIFSLAKLSKEFGHGSAFYFMSTGPGPMEADYRIDANYMRAAIQDLHQQGYEIGFHPGYATFKNPEKLRAEKERLEEVFDGEIVGGRQHFLRFEAPITWRHWESIGLSYDSTVGYADHEGFRCGTCHPFRPFDLEEDREINLWEYPLIVMDVTLKRYRQLSPQLAADHTIGLINRCRKVGGTFTLLWHNSSLCRDWLPWLAFYEQTLAQLSTL